MRIIKEGFLVQAGIDYPKAARFLENWRTIVRAAEWKSLVDLRKTYPSVDVVKVESGRQVVVFNVCGNDYRLLTAMHFNRQVVYTLRFMTHAEYSKDRWKDEL